MRSIFARVSLGSSMSVLSIFILGIAQMSGAQLASKLSASAAVLTSTKAGHQQTLADANPPGICTSAAKTAQPAAHGPHTATLSWHASVPGGPNSNDAISCYLIYRTADSWDPDKAPMVGVTRAPNTTYVDLHVESGNYYYAVRAVSHGGAQSKFSRELPVQVPVNLGSFDEARRDFEPPETASQSGYNARGNWRCTITVADAQVSPIHTQ